MIGAPARWTNKAVCRGQEGQSGGGGHPWAGLAEAERSSARFAPELAPHERSSLRSTVRFFFAPGFGNVGVIYHDLFFFFVDAEDSTPEGRA